MVDINAWLADGEAIAEAPRAVRAWNRILDKPTSVSFRTPAGVSVGAQTVRVELGEGVHQATSPAGAQTVRSVVIFGVRNHPDPNVPDTDVASGYRFVLDGKEYQVRDVVETLGEVQARAEVIS